MSPLSFLCEVVAVASVVGLISLLFGTTKMPQVHLVYFLNRFTSLAISLKGLIPFTGMVSEVEI